MLSVRLGGERLVVLVEDVKRPRVPALTAAEREVAEQVSAGLSNQEIASTRKTSVHTVANQVASVMQKLGVGSRIGIARAWSSPRSIKSRGGR